MDDKLRSLKGSENRDFFKYMHKQSPNPPNHYAFDLDLALISKRLRGILAALDYKTLREGVTFTEVLGFNDLLNMGRQVRLIRSRPLPHPDIEQGKFIIQKYLGGDEKPDPPIYKVETVLETKTWEEFAKWERDLRRYLEQKP